MVELFGQTRTMEYRYRFCVPILCAVPSPSTTDTVLMRLVEQIGGWEEMEESKDHEEVQGNAWSSTEIVASEGSESGKIDFLRVRPSVTIEKDPGTCPLH